jgi:hypothetical protein
VSTAQADERLLRGLLLEELELNGPKSLFACSEFLRQIPGSNAKVAKKVIEDGLHTTGYFVTDDESTIWPARNGVPALACREERKLLWGRFANSFALSQSFGADQLHALFSDREAELFVAEFLASACGWRNVRITRPSHDFGLDILGDIPAPPNGSLAAIAQVKWYNPISTDVTIQEVQAAYGAASPSVCYFVTTSNFTSPTEMWSRKQKGLFLVDGAALISELRRYIRDNQK